MATQSRVSGSRITTRRVLPDQERGSDGGPLYNSYMKRVVYLNEGAYRDHCPNLMEFLYEELINVQERQKFLVKVGTEAGCGSPLFQKPVLEWRESLDLASDSLYQAQQEKNKFRAVTFQTTVEKVRHPQPREPELEYRKVTKRKYPDPPLVDIYETACVSLAMEMADEVTEKNRAAVLWSFCKKTCNMFKDGSRHRPEPKWHLPQNGRWSSHTGYDIVSEKILTDEMRLILMDGYKIQVRRSW